MEWATDIKTKYDALVSLNKSKWTKEDYKLAIQRHHGDKTTVPKGETAMSSLLLSKAKSIYTHKYKDKDPPLIRTWTPRMEAKLIRLERGEINDIQETSIYSNAKKTNEE